MLIQWLKHLIRSQILAFLVSLLFIVSIVTPTFTDSPLTVRRQLQLDSAHTLYDHHATIGTILLHVPIFDQLPSLYNGCEVTSLAMLLRYEGFSVTPRLLARQIGRDPTPIKMGPGGNIVYWGNPNLGFVGSISGRTPGYGVYHGPLFQLMRRYLPHRAQDVTGIHFRNLLRILATGRPVVVWTTINFSPVSNWITWESPSGAVRATLQEHAVVTVGYNQHDVFVNNPLNGEANEPVPIASFRASWIALGRQAITLSAKRDATLFKRKSMSQYGSTKAVHGGKKP